MAETVFIIVVIRHHGAGPSDDTEDFGILLEGVKVSDEFEVCPFCSGNVAFASVRSKPELPQRAKIHL